LRNSTGHFISFTDKTFTQPIDQVARNITILDRFNGKCMGIKYYKSAQPMYSDFHYPWDVIQTTIPDFALVSLYFNSSGLVAESKT
jgi:hypothetical protein